MKTTVSVCADVQAFLAPATAAGFTVEPHLYMFDGKITAAIWIERSSPAVLAEIHQVHDGYHVTAARREGHTPTLPEAVALALEFEQGKTV